MQNRQSSRLENRRRVSPLLLWIALPTLLLVLFFGVHRFAVGSVGHLAVDETTSMMKADYQPWLVARFIPLDGSIRSVIQEEDGITSVVSDVRRANFWVGGDDAPLAAAQNSAPINEPSARPTATPTPIDTPQINLPPVFFPSKTPKPKATKTKVPDTPVPPTNTPIPPTNTPLPPTDTPVPPPPPPPFDCSTLLKVGGVGTDTKVWTISNNSGINVSLTKFTVNWDASTGTSVSWINVGGGADEFTGPNSTGSVSVSGSWSIAPGGGTIGVAVKFSAIPSGVSTTAIVNGCSK